MQKLWCKTALQGATICFLLLKTIDMNILITNDDGYRANGIRVLAEMMDRFGDVTVIAPKHHQSAMGMAVSLGFKKLAYKELPDMGPGKWSYLDATPASCIKFGLNFQFLDKRPDVVICGVNHGSNASSAACYSATLGSAEEGALNGIPAIGVSLDDVRTDADFSAVKAIFPQIFEKLMSSWDRSNYGLMYNVNFPASPLSGIKGIRVARQGRGHWIKEFRDWDPCIFARYHITEEMFGKLHDTPLEDGEKAYLMVGDFVDDEPCSGNADHRLNGEGYVTVTPENLDKTDYADLRRIESIINEDFPVRP